jgi:hypothetical protein
VRPETLRSTLISPVSSRTATFEELLLGIIYVTITPEEVIAGPKVLSGLAATSKLALETITILYFARFFVRLLLVSGLVLIALICGLLLHGELTKAWASELSRFTSRRPERS